jgi:hypothetical protein
MINKGATPVLLPIISLISKMHLMAAAIRVISIVKKERYHRNKWEASLPPLPINHPAPVESAVTIFKFPTKQCWNMPNTSNRVG